MKAEQLRLKILDFVAAYPACTFRQIAVGVECDSYSKGMNKVIVALKELSDAGRLVREGKGGRNAPYRYSLPEGEHSLPERIKAHLAAHEQATKPQLADALAARYDQVSLGVNRLVKQGVVEQIVPPLEDYTQPPFYYALVGLNKRCKGSLADLDT